MGKTVLYFSARFLALVRARDVLYLFGQKIGRGNFMFYEMFPPRLIMLPRFVAKKEQKRIWGETINLLQ